MKQILLKFLPFQLFKPASSDVTGLQGELTQSERAFFIARNRRLIGQWAENLAAEFLISHGLRVMERNVRERFSELDLVCRDGNELVFVEVRCRRSNGIMSAQESVGRQKLLKLQRGAELYVLKKDWRGSWRVDLVSIDVKGRCWHLKWFKYLEMEG
ncbi:MAG: YraN family protein [Pyramidobacter sp.]|jgi:putative endonuclease